MNKLPRLAKDLNKEPKKVGRPRKLPEVEVVQHFEDDPCNLLSPMGSRCYWNGYDAENKMISTGDCDSCWGGCHHESIFRSKGWFDAFYKVAETPYEEKDVKRWVAFCTLAGFPCEYQGIVTDFKGNIPFFKITIPAKKYKSINHLWVGITCIRYFSYSYCSDFKLLPQAAFEVKSLLKDKIDYMQAIILAHYKACKGDYFDRGHGLFGIACKLLTKEQMIKSANESFNCNSTFENYSVPLSWGKLHKLIAENNYDEVLKVSL